jgi:hypothetical protein
MIDRQEFVAMCAASLLQQGKDPSLAAERAEALALNLEKRNISMWKKDPDKKIIVEELGVGSLTPAFALLEWIHRRWKDPACEASDVVLQPGFYRITVSALDKAPNVH